MSEIQCGECTARFRMSLGPGAPARATVPCPRCGSLLEILAPKATVAPPTTVEPTEPHPTGWKKVDRSKLFGSTSPLPEPQQQRPEPVSERPRAFASTPSPKLGLFLGAQAPQRQPTRAPESDRPETLRPLANALLRELRGGRSSEIAAELPPPSPPVSPRESPPTTSEFLSDQELDALILPLDNPTPVPGRLPSGLRTDEASDADETQPLPSADAPITLEEEIPDLDDEALEDLALDDEAHSGAPEPPELPEPPEPPEPPAVPQPALPAEKTYSLRVGDQVYADISRQGLIELFRRGVWVVADEIAETDGPWMAIEEHPVFERIRLAIAESLTGLLLTHGELLQNPPSRAPAAPAITSVSIEAPALPRAPSTTLPWTIALISTSVASAAIAGMAVGYALMGAPWQSTTDAEAVVVAPLADPEPRPTQAEDIQAALLTARELIGEAAEITPADLAMEAMARGDFPEARRIAAASLSSSHDPESLREVFRRAVAEDPLLRPPLRTITPDVDADLIRALGGGSSVTFRLTRGGESLFAYKVNRQEWEEGYRVEVAAYLLCEILPCGFKIPRNEVARIERAHFDDLYGRLQTERQLAYAESRFEEMIWHDETGLNGRPGQFLYGALKEWIPNYVNLPVEYTTTWRHWLDPSRQGSLDEPFEDYLDRIRPYQQGRFATGLSREYQEPTVRELAAQISDLMVFDYLINNFDRFSRVEDYYGVNAHFADGGFVAIDNSAAFQFRSLRRVDQRFEQVGRFRRTLIDAIRLMEPETVDPILFPDADGRDQIRLRVFWQQRDKLLAHVDALVAEHGEEAVFPFD